MGRTSDAKERLLASAIELIYARSYASVGVQEICERAGVRKGSFYHFFPSKRGLTLAALEHLWSRSREEVLGRAFSASCGPLERIGRFFDTLYDWQSHRQAASGQVQGCPYGNLACEMSTQDEAIRAKLNDIFRGIQGHIETALRDAVAAGELTDIDTQAGAQAIFAYMEGLLMLAKTLNDPEPIRRLGHGAVPLALAAGR